MGGHRIDLARKASTVLTVAEAAAIIILLHYGYNLFAMACVMAASELVYLTYCYAVAHKVVPEVRVAIRYMSTHVLGELVRFAGSYQLVNVLQLTYAAIVPIVVLRAYGADASGVYAVATRLTQPVLLCHNAFLLPILSGGAMVYAARETEKLRKLLAKSLKVTLALTLTPFALVSAFGVWIVQAWTGQTDPSFHYAIWLLCISSLFQSLAMIGLVLYRAAGGAVMDNLHQLIRLAAFLPVALMTQRFGFEGVLVWMTGAEFIGVLVMIFAVAKSFHVFDGKLLMADAARLLVATAAILAVAAFAVHLLPDGLADNRLLAALKVAVVYKRQLLAAYPALHFTGAVSNAEIRSVIDVFRRSRVVATD